MPRSSGHHPTRPNSACFYNRFCRYTSLHRSESQPYLIFEREQKLSSSSSVSRWGNQNQNLDEWDDVINCDRSENSHSNQNTQTQALKSQPDFWKYSWCWSGEGERLGMDPSGHRHRRLCNEEMCCSSGSFMQRN